MILEKDNTKHEYKDDRKENESKVKKMNKRLNERTEAMATEDRRGWGIYLAAH